MTIDEFKEASAIEKTIEDIRRRRYDWETITGRSRKSFAKEIEDVQAKCKHWFTKHHADPSGNNDSHTECLICGAEVR